MNERFGARHLNVRLLARLVNARDVLRLKRFLPGVFFFALLQTTHAANLWDGEEVRMGAGYPFIAKFVAAERDAPLVVFIPGARSLARIAYGGHEGGLDEDFLAYWLNREGYNFLGISYPVLTADGAFDEAHPDMTVRAWGHGSAEITKAVMEERGLTGPVIVAVWSMGGKSVQPFAEAAAELGIDLDFHVALAATPTPNWPSISAATTSSSSAKRAHGKRSPRSGNWRRGFIDSRQISPPLGQAPRISGYRRYPRMRSKLTLKGCVNSRADAPS